MLSERRHGTMERDPIVAEVIGNRLTNIALEMATTLMRTSGSPVLTEAKDFSNAVFDRDAELVGFSGYVVLHIGSSIEGVRAVAREYGGDIHPHDAFICNDPYTAGAIHQGDVGIVTPLFWRDEHVGWAFSNAHVLDVGGMSPGGWAPVAYDCYGEALRFPPLRIVERGVFVREIERLLVHNVRLPIVMNDIKSLVAANNAAQARLEELLDQYGLEDYERYCAVNASLSEDVVRERIESIPDGVYEAIDWVEYDGHGSSDLLKIHMRLVVSGSSIVVDLSDTDAQSDGFVNAGYGAVAGQIGANVLLGLAYDVPVNAGILRPVKIVLPEEGSMLNPTVPAPVSCGHMEGAMRTGRIYWEAFSKAVGLSDLPAIRARATAASAFAWPGNAWAGVNRRGEYTAFAVMDASSCGGGARTVIDGLDVGAIEHMLDAGIPDVETNESFYPMLYLWRRLNASSGGPGRHRGGQGLDLAWVPYGIDLLMGTLENAAAFLPSRGTAGGYPGATNSFNVIRGSDIQTVIAARKPLPQSLEELGGTEETLLNHTAGVALTSSDVFHQVVGGGAGMGDPLLRDPERVAADVRDGYVSRAQAYSAYGVAVSEAGVLDEAATTDRRDAIRTARIGGRPAHDPLLGEAWRHPLRLADENFECSYCGEELAPIAANWKESVIHRSFGMVDHLAERDIVVQRHPNTAFVLHEWACPGCGMMLETNVYPEGLEPLHDVRPGSEIATGALEPGAARAI